MTAPTDYSKYRIWFSVFLAVLLAGFFIGMLAYSGPFNPVTDPFSWLGASETQDGKDNRDSMAVFAVTMVLSALIFIYLTILFAKDRGIPFRGVRIAISILAAFGACVATFPNNYYLTQHQLGSGLLVGSVWLHSILFIVDASHGLSKRYSLFLHLLLQSTVLTYAYAFVVDAPNRDLFQKFAIAGLALAIELSLASLCRVTSAVNEYKETEAH